MLQLKEVSKEYLSGDLHQTALDHVSLSFRDNEFVAVLGPSGSGKTTLLNVIGGLDRYDSGDLLVDGVSTKGYNDRDWDAFRNHRVGFVFQNYNLIPHQSVLANVELSLTISGVSKAERKKRAEEVLQRVGLGEQLHKTPAQLSGGQMQRVAIARALINDPSILLADEPTGALDSETSVQVMDLLKEVAADRLVVMVTHNPELAQRYATRTVQLVDGRVVEDSDPFAPEEDKTPIQTAKGSKKASMSFATALSLSFSNLKTKKGRYALTAFAGSIGIIGIAIILTIASGVNSYISDIQKNAMASYPISIESESMDLGNALSDASSLAGSGEEEHDLDAVYADSSALVEDASMSALYTKNNLAAFKKYLDDPQSDVRQYLDGGGISYSYDTKFSVYAYDSDGILVDGSASAASSSADVDSSDLFADSDTSAANNTAGDFSQIMPGLNGELVSPAVTESYDVLYGSWPQSYDEVVLVLDENNEISADTLYSLGLLKASDYQALSTNVAQGESTSSEANKWSYEDACSQALYLVSTCDFYAKSTDGIFSEVASGKEIKKLVDSKSFKLKISGIVRASEDSEGSLLSSTVGYTSALTDQLIEYAAKSEVVKAQKKTPKVDVLTGVKFSKEGTSSYEANMEAFGYTSLDEPSAINIYTSSFENKEAVIGCIDAYNNAASSDDKITYTDYMQMLMSSVTTIVNIISYILIAFVAVSLVVSSIMIGIITYISVLERTKEIGILRAVGASKRNISQVFNAETAIVGLGSGLIGVGLTLLLLLPGNAILHMAIGTSDVSASLPPVSALVLVVLSILLTMIGGIIPARKAARKDPVAALRSE